jgi:murein DD-endopeptidase MepM/ murein hydrolase activator NlpD
LAQKAEYEAEFYAALVSLLGPEGAAAAFAEYERDLAAQYGAEAAARDAAYAGGPVLSGSWALPLAGRFTSCFCERWGTMHWGIDIAAPMYTPMYSAGDGTVIRAGPATGFGQAVYVQHDNGDVTVYGHMEVIEVVAGQRVAAGQEIALVGTQGFSTGPHLHFEVYVGGLDGFRVDPVLWLANRGIYV